MDSDWEHSRVSRFRSFLNDIGDHADIIALSQITQREADLLKNRRFSVAASPRSMQAAADKRNTNACVSRGFSPQNQHPPGGTSGGPTAMQLASAFCHLTASTWNASPTLQYGAYF